jgi:hypothetical protein
VGWGVGSVGTKVRGALATMTLASNAHRRSSPLSLPHTPALPGDDDGLVVCFAGVVESGAFEGDVGGLCDGVNVRGEVPPVPSAKHLHHRLIQQFTF